MARRLTAGEAAQFRSWFPHLNTGNVWVLAEATPRYNCLAWALGYTDRWVWPWQPNLPGLPAMSTYIRRWGYVPGQPAAAVVYGATASAIGHIGRFWVNQPSSKCGQSLMITHGWAELNYGIYGSNRQSYGRRAGAAALAAEEVTALESMPLVEATEQSDLPVLLAAEVDKLAELSEAVPADARSAFDAAYERWKAVLTTGDAAADSTGARAMHSSEFVAAVAAARDAVPRLMDKLADPDEHFALLIAQQILPPEVVPIYEPDDPLVLEGEHARALTTLGNWLHQ